MDLAAVIQVVKEWGPVFGPVILVLAFFLWKDWRRELRLQNRVEALEREHKEVILPLVKDCSAIISQNTSAMARLEKVLEQKSQALTLLEKVLDRQAILAQLESPLERDDD